MTDKEARQTGVEDSPVEITHEMIEGGAALLRTWDSEFVSPEQMVSEVFRVMDRAKAEKCASLSRESARI